jgi:hypothetical protein
MRLAALLCALLFMAFPVNAMQKTQQLFHIERSKNANIVRYDVNLGPDGKIDTKAPISGYWIMLAKGAGREELNSIEKRVYGFSVSEDKSKTFFLMKIKPFKDKGIKVYRLKNKYVAEMNVNGRPAYLFKVYINATDTKMFPKVNFIDLSGKDKKTGKDVCERIKE